ncbi:uncharacterized protein L199_003185 [Kwoniella botswanensis]|uniref:uncharacterized protein n=1 Tax=Kwoniella botswanensis TaxID=1268659 RepID=UPI00315D0B7E
MLAKAAFPALFFTLAGFILLLLVTLSVPIIKSIYLLQVRFDRSGTTGSTSLGANAGVFGLCYQGGQATAVIKGLAGSLILNAIAAGFAGLSLVWSVFAWLCASRGWEIFTFISLFFSVLTAWLAWALDLTLALVARHRIEDASDDVLDARIGNGVWLALGGAVAVTIALCLAGCGMFGRYRSDRVVQQKPVGYRRRYFWQRNHAGRGTY